MSSRQSDHRRWVGFLVAVVLGLAPGAAFGQFTDADGGDHGGADYTPGAGVEIGGVHTNVGNFVIPLGQTNPVRMNQASPGGNTFDISAATITIAGTLDGSGRGFGGGAGGCADGCDAGTATAFGGVGGSGGDGGANNDDGAGSDAGGGGGGGPNGLPGDDGPAVPFLSAAGTAAGGGAGGGAAAALGGTGFGGGGGGGGNCFGGGGGGGGGGSGGANAVAANAGAAGQGAAAGAGGASGGACGTTTAGGNGGYASPGINGDTTTDTSFLVGSGGGGGGGFGSGACGACAGGGGGGGGAGGARIALRATGDITVSGTIISQGSGGGNNGGGGALRGGGGAGGGILISGANVTLTGTLDNRGRLADALSPVNGGTLKAFHTGALVNTAVVTVGRLLTGAPPAPAGGGAAAGDDDDGRSGFKKFIKKNKCFVSTIHGSQGGLGMLLIAVLLAWVTAVYARSR